MNSRKGTNGEYIINTLNNVKVEPTLKNLMMFEKTS